MSYRLKLVTPPTSEPVSLPELKAHCRVDWTDEDTTLSLYLQAAREAAEAYTARAFLSSRYLLTLPIFPANGGPIRIPRLPLIAIRSIIYTDSAGNSTTLYQHLTDTGPETGSIDVDAGDDAADVYPGSANGNAWPTISTPARVKVTFDAGYSTVPAVAKQAILLYAAHLYRNREAVSELPLKEVPFTVCALLDTIRNHSTTDV